MPDRKPITRYCVWYLDISGPVWCWRQTPVYSFRECLRIVRVLAYFHPVLKVVAVRD